jgi:hypothetical protein
MFRALLAYLQEAVNKRNLVYCVLVMSVGCYQDWSGTGVTPGALPSKQTETVCRYQKMVGGSKSQYTKLVCRSGK